MTIEEAREAVGQPVVYRTAAMRDGRDRRPPEDGVISSVGDHYVHVSYSGRVMATYPEDLELAHGNLS